MGCFFSKSRELAHINSKKLISYTPIVKPEDTPNKYYINNRKLQDNDVTAECQTCGKSFKRKQEDTWRKLCSNSCKPRDNGVMVKCQTCGKSFKRRPEDTWRKFCSKDCNTTGNCKRCDKVFPKTPNESWKTCCSKECSDLLLVTKNCVKCGKDFSIINSEKWKNFCGKSYCVTSGNRVQDNNKSKGFSDKAIVWLEQIAKANNIYIQHAKNGGEFSINMKNSFIKFDGFCKETKTVYEFHGDYWHGNPKLYNSNEMNTRAGKTFGELYQKTIEREEFIRSQGYTLITIWESDFDAN